MTQNSIGVSIPVPVTQGGTNATTAPGALTNLGAVPLAGGTMTGLLVLSGDPAVALGAATKQYVDTIASGITIKESCYASTTANLNTTYNNGAAGVGATLTENVNGAFTTDGTTPNVGDRILVQFQTAQEENGIYEVTDAGSAGTPYILTRTTDYDSAAEITAGSLVIVNNGTLYSTTSWIQTATVAVVGTDPIMFSQFTAGVGANTALSNLIATSINQDLIPGVDIAVTLGTPTQRWDIGYIQEILTGTTAADELVLGAYDVDGAVYVDFISLIAGNTPTCALSGSVTGVTQALGTDDTRLATTAFVQDAIDDLALDKANVTLNNLAAVAINTSLISDTDLADDLGSQAIRWDQLFVENVCTGDTAGDVLTLGAWDVDGAAYVEFVTLTANNTPTCVLNGNITSTTQAPLDNSTKLATTAYVDAATGGGSGANTALSNLAAVAINTSLISDTDVTDNLGSQAIRWNNIYAATLQTGDTAADTLQIGAWDVDGASFVPFFTLTANNTPTGVLASGVTGTTQAANDNSTKLATTAYADAAAGARANVALSNLSGVAVNASLTPGSDNAIDLGTGTARWRAAYLAQLKTGTTAADTLVISARDVDGAADTAFITLTAGNTPTCVLSGAVTGTTQAASDNSTKLATTAYVDNQVSTSGANTALSNLAAVAINTTLVSDTDNTDDLGSGTVRWANVYPVTLRTGTSAANTMKLQARDVDGAAWTDFITLTANNTPTCAIAGATITGGTVSGLSSPIVVADGGTGVATLTTAYGTLCAGTTATAAIQTVSPGTAGHVLTSNGSSALPSYQAPAAGGGGLTLLLTQTASGAATVDFSSTYITSTYESYLLVYTRVDVNTSGSAVWARVATGGVYKSGASDYKWVAMGYNSLASSETTADDADSEIQITNASNAISTTTLDRLNGHLFIHSITSASFPTMITGQCTYRRASSYLEISDFVGQYLTVEANDGFRMMASSGNISGIFKLYGIQSS